MATESMTLRHTEDAGPDPHRPSYHFLPHANWMNDPNGLIHWQGRYHLFYQYNPNGPFHGTIHWGHASSTDLVHWVHHPIALAPDPDGPDAQGCWSGCAVDDDGVPTILYTSGNPQTQCLATGSPDLLTWTKYTGNPVIARPPDTINAGQPWDMRDPYVWREGSAWYMLLGSRIEGHSGTALLYRSEDLRSWTYLHPLLLGDPYEVVPDRLGTMWECPNLLPLGDQHLLVVSLQDIKAGRLHYPIYLTGTYENTRFSPEYQGRVDYGEHFYAPQIMRDAAGRALMWGWVWEGRTQAAQLQAGWAGVMSLPRELSLTEQGHLVMRPARELRRLRGRRHSLGGQTLSSGEAAPLEGLRGMRLEMLARLSLTPDAQLNLRVRQAPDDAEYTLVTVDAARKRLIVDRRMSSLDPASHRDIAVAPLEHHDLSNLSLHLYLDHSVLEIFIDYEICLVSRIYPTRPDSDGMSADVSAGNVELQSLDIWELDT